MAMPETVDQGFVAISLWLYVAAALQLQQQPEWLLPVAVWILAAMQVTLRRISMPDVIFDGGWFVGAKPLLARLALLTIGLPTLLSWLAQRAGYRLVVASLVLAYSPTLMRHGLPPLIALLAAPGVAVGVLLSIQKGSLRLARHLAVDAGRS